MKKTARRCALILGLATPAALLGAAAALAQSQTLTWQQQQERNAQMQRQALMQQSREAPSAGVSMVDRWTQEWKQQHPGQPVPSLPVLEHMHEGDIQANINAGFAAMRARRQAELQSEYLRAKQIQQRQLDAQHVTWNAQQWAAWNKQYDDAKHQEANDYLEMVRREGERQREEMRRANGY
jgi:hypothetical protein